MAMILAIHTPLLWFVGLLRSSGPSTANGARRPKWRWPWRKSSRRTRCCWRSSPAPCGGSAGSRYRGIETSVALLAQAGVPCAQIALGASLTRFAIKGQMPTLSLLLVLKLLAFPFAVWLTSVELLHLPKPAAEVALLFASMPAGANAYLFAERTGRVVNSASGAVALGTILAARHRHRHGRHARRIDRRRLIPRSTASLIALTFTPRGNHRSCRTSSNAPSAST